MTGHAPLPPSVHELIIGKKTNIAAPGQPIRLAQQEPLIWELESAVKGESTGTGEATNGGPKVPLSMSALALWERITKTVNEQWPGRNQRALQRLSVGQKIHAWAQGDPDYVEEVCAVWCGQIKGLRYRVHALDAACPECGVDTVYEVDEGDPDGRVYKPALVWTVERAFCRACLASWVGFDEMKELAGVINRHV
ncbi:hypothetical protein VVR12_01755 [Rothia sp. LK2588]|uniref:DUF7341 domain-containing protein n=1 Tax=Rothia sp. LK2588 TaxID=3114369 RepID=UPI0034CF4F6E